MNTEQVKRLLQCDAKGNPLPTSANVELILSNHDDWAGVLAYDELSECVVCLREPPFMIKNTD